MRRKTFQCSKIRTRQAELALVKSLSQESRMILALLIGWMRESHFLRHGGKGIVACYKKRDSPEFLLRVCLGTFSAARALGSVAAIETGVSG